MQNKVSEKAQEKIFSILLRREENLECADCRAKGPRWVSLDYGVFICMNCAGAHRTLGPSVTRVRSIKLDGWVQDNIDIMEAIGNTAANSYWENQMPKSYNKPGVNASLEGLIRFVNDKYVKKLFVVPRAVDPKTHYLATKQTVKPHYFDQAQAQPQQTSETKVNTTLGDLIEMDHEEFHDYSSQPPVEPPKAHSAQDISNLSNYCNDGSTSHHLSSFQSLSPEKHQQQQQQPMSTPQLDLMSLYNQQQNNVLQVNSAFPQSQNNTNKYAALQNMGRAPPQQHYYQQPPQHAQWQSQQQIFTPQQSYSNQYPQQPSNQPVNIMNLYVQQHQTANPGFQALRQINPVPPYQ